MPPYPNKDLAITRQYWNNNVIEAINDLIDNAPEDCPLPDPLPVAERGTALGKKIFRRVRETLLIMCPETDFGPLPSIATLKLVNDILEAIDHGYCDCGSKESGDMTLIISYGNAEEVEGTVTIEVSAGESTTKINGELSGIVVGIFVSIDGEDVVSLAMVFGVLVSFLAPNSLDESSRDRVIALAKNSGFPLPPGILSGV